MQSQPRGTLSALFHLPTVVLLSKSCHLDERDSISAHLHGAGEGHTHLLTSVTGSHILGLP